MRPNAKVLGGFPPMWKARMKYVETITLDPASGSVAAYQFDLRSMYDPNSTGTGHQPSNFDRFMQIYNKWTVTKTAFLVSNAWNSTSSVTPGVWGFLISKSGSQVSGFSNIDQLLEQPYVKYARTPAGVSNTTPYPGSISATIPSGPWLGIRDNRILFTDEYSGDGSTGPVETVYAEVFFGNIAGNDPGAVPFRVEIQFTCTFFEPKITLPSVIAREPPSPGHDFVPVAGHFLEEHKGATPSFGMLPRQNRQVGDPRRAKLGS